jgi:hypothetical protein
MKQIWDQYGKKTPQIKEYLKAFAQAFELDVPWMRESTFLDPGGIPGNTTNEGIWSPGEIATDAPSDSGQKLWLPGQS